MPADGGANGVTIDWLYSTAHRQRPFIRVLVSLHLWQRSFRERGTNGRGPAPATTAMWPAVLHGRRPGGLRAATRRIDRYVMP